MNRHRAPRTWVVALVLVIVWGAGAFGSPYPWAYVPLQVASVVLGAIGLLIGRREVPIAVVAGLGLVTVAALLQLIPIAPWMLERISPAALAIHHRLVLTIDHARWLPLTIDSNRTLLGIAFLVSLSVLLTGCARVLDRESARSLSAGIALVGVALALAGIIQRGMFNGKIYGFWPLVQGGIPFGPYVNRNHFAGWMLMGIPISIGLLAAAASRGTRNIPSRGRQRLLWLSSPEASRVVLLGFGILLMVVALVLTLSRSGILALAVGLLLASVFISRRETSPMRRFAIPGYLLIVAIAAASWVGIDQIAARFAEGDLASVNERPAIWADTIAIIRDFRSTGSGLNTFGVSTLFYQTSVPTLHLREAHNDYLQLAAEGGLLMGVPILFAIAAVAVSVRRRLREDVGSAWWIRMGAVTGMLAVALQSTVEFSLQMPGNAVLFTALCGIALHDGRPN